jgi:hypothetical protein
VVTNGADTVLLSNPPGFVLLALIFALAAYLRQIAENRADFIEEIQRNRVWNYPLGEKHTDMQIKRLRISSWVFAWIARGTIAFRLAALA